MTLDLPGHGLTGPVPGDDYSPDGMVRFVDAFAKKLGLVHFYLGGNSMGGNVAFRYTRWLMRKWWISSSSSTLGGLTHLLPKDHQPVLPIGFKLMRTPGVESDCELHHAEERGRKIDPRRFRRSDESDQ